MTAAIRVMTFNINGAADVKDDPNAWTLRAPLNVSLIHKYAPDLIGMQEVHPVNLETYRVQLTGYTHVRGNCYGDVPPTEYTSIFWKAARFDLIDHYEFWLSGTPEVESADWEVEYPMGVTWVRLRDKASGKPIVHLNTHFEDGSWGEKSRVESAKLMVKRTAAEQAGGLAVVLTGDFNCNPGSSAHQIFTDAGFADAFLAAGNTDGRESSFHGYLGDGYDPMQWGVDPFWRVDWIMVSGVQTNSCQIVRDATPPSYPSDHYPVVADLSLLYG